MKHNVISIEGKSLGSVDLPQDIFSVKAKESVVASVVRWQMANRRSGSHKTKTVSEISGTTKKPFNQKGTGNARQGSLRSVQFRGGAVSFGPVVRDHGFAMPKKIRKLALKMVLSDKIASGKVIVMDSFKMKTKKVKDFLSAMKNCKIDKNVLFLGAKKDNDVSVSSNNLYGYNALPVAGLNVYDILKMENLVIEKDAIDMIVGRLQK